MTTGAWDDHRNFERFLGYRSGLVAASLPGLLPISEDELQAAHGQAGEEPAAKATLDISLVIDTTGSMGDEIAYLQAEFMALSSTIADQYPGSEQRWSLVTYKDAEDEYVVRWRDFRTDPEDSYFVTSLSSAIVRMVDIELSGQYHEPGASEVLRTGGDPEDGACKLASGETAFAF